MIDWGINYLKWWTALTLPMVMTTILYWVVVAIHEYKKIKGGEEDMEENVNHPQHYNQHPSGVECIDIARHYPFAIGNAIKYLWRAGLKKDAALEDVEKEIEDLNKAIWYINDRINQLRNGRNNNNK